MNTKQSLGRCPLAILRYSTFTIMILFTLNIAHKWWASDSVDPWWFNDDSVFFYWRLFS